MILKAIVIDDEPLAHEIIKNYVADIDFIEIVGHFHLATQAISFLNQEDVDLIFLDIQMPKLKGNEFLRTLSTKPAIIITTAFEEYALESFELDVTDYLLKPFRFERFLKAVNKVFEQYQLKLSKEPTKDAVRDLPTDQTHRILIKVDKKHLSIQVKEISHLESYGNYVKVWIAGEYQLTPRTLSSFEEQLESGDFIRIHKSFIVNKQFINYWEGNSLLMKDDIALPISKSYKQGLKAFLN